MKRIAAFLLTVLILACALAGCSTQKKQTAPSEPLLPDGIYEAEFNTDSSMFHVNEAYNGKGTLTVKDGIMTIHVSLASKSILNLYAGLAEDAKKDGAVLLEPTVDTVDYNDGTTDEVYGFDIPVTVLNEEFDVALVGKKGVWYDHKVSVTNPVLKPAIEDGAYSVDLTMEGGTGKSYINSPCTITVKNGKMTAELLWSSDKYDYMIVDGVKYEPISLEGGSCFEIPVSALDTEIAVIGDTVAMSTPHEIEYKIQFISSSMVKK